MELIGTLLSTMLAGGATGLLGAGLQLLFGWLKTKQDIQLFNAKAAHELQMRDKDAALMQAEWQGRLRVAQAEGEAQADVAKSNAFQATMLREPERYSNASTLSPGQQWFMVLLDFARGVVRPVLTVYLCLLTTYIWWQVRALVSQETLDADAVLQIWRLVVETILYLTTTVVLWWFGTRNGQVAPGTPQRTAGG